MGESIVAASYNGDKMGEMAAAVPALNVSVSFGKFEKDSLSWEKWSSFSPNKYLEEVEKCATPGSVAEKKSYFEAHYKKIAARKAALIDQEKRVEDDSLVSNGRNKVDSWSQQNNEDTGICETDSKADLYSGQRSIDGVALGAKLDGELGHNVDILDEDAAEKTEGQISSVTRVKEEQGSSLDCLMLKEPEDVVSTREEERSNNLNEELNSKLGSPTPMLIKTKETAVLKEVETDSPSMLSSGKDSAKKAEKEMERIPTSGEENVKSGQRKEPPKKTITSKVREVVRTKKPISPVTKASQASTPKVRNPVPTSTALSASWSSTKKVTGSLSLKGKNPPAEDTKKVAPKSLHMSLSMEPPPSSSPASPSPPTIARKSLIMEKMGDKDIVKRAFKTFQNNYNQLKASSEERFLRAKQVHTKETEIKVSATASPRRVNGGSSKLDGVDKKTAKSALSYFGLKHDERAKKKEELSKKLGEKSSAKEIRSVNLQAKSKERKVAEVEKQRHSLNFKASPMPGFSRTQKASRGPLDKEGSKTLQI